MICYLEPDKTQVKNNKRNYQNSKQKANNIRVKKDNYNYLRSIVILSRVQLSTIRK